MNVFNIDKPICKRDGKCAAVCPVGIIGADEQGFPVIAPGAHDRCINCGHCAAVCPYGALSLETMPDKLLALPEGWNLSVSQVEYLLKGRRSIRVFRKDPVDRRILEKIIDIARYAPSGLNRQPVRWVIVHDPQKTADVARETIAWMRAMIKEKSPLAGSLNFGNMVAEWDKGKDYICRGAPHLVILYALKDDMTAQGSCMLAGSYFELAALPHGVGTCWAGYAAMALNRWPAAAEIVNISRKCSCYGVLLAGYPGLKFAAIPMRNGAKITWR